MSMRGAHSGYSIPLLLSYICNSPSLLRYLRFRSRHLCAEHLFPLLSKQRMILAWLKIVSGLPAISVLSVFSPAASVPSLPSRSPVQRGLRRRKQGNRCATPTDRIIGRSGGARVSDRASDGAASVVVRAPRVASVDRPSPPQHPLSDPTWHWQTAG